VEHLLGDLEGGLVAVLLLLHHARHPLHALHQLRVSRPHQLRDEAGQLVKERVEHTGHARVAHGAAHDLSQHVAAALVGRQDAVVDEERRGTAMVGHDSQCGIGSRIFAVAGAEELGRPADDGSEQIAIEVGKLALHERRHALEPHAGIDGGARQGCHHATVIPVELHEDQVPDFDKAPAGVARELLVFVPWLGRLRSQIVVNLRTGAAGAGFAHLPEVVLFIEPEDAALRHAGDLLPKQLGLVILAEYREVEAVFGDAVILRDQIPGKRDGVGLEVVSEREVAEHLEERMVPPRVAHVFEVVVFASRADALLRGRGPCVVALLGAEEHVLELIHSGVGEEQSRIVGRHQGGTAHHPVVSLFEKGKEFLADLVTGHRFIVTWSRISSQIRRTSARGSGARVTWRPMTR
jgi:hypothetical protein